jgi:hypothetical protein
MGLVSSHVVTLDSAYAEIRLQTARISNAAVCLYLDAHWNF